MKLPDEATILPEFARTMLKEAAAVPHQFGSTAARRKAVDKAIKDIKRRCPQHFRQDA